MIIESKVCLSCHTRVPLTGTTTLVLDELEDNNTDTPVTATNKVVKVGVYCCPKCSFVTQLAE